MNNLSVNSKFLVILAVLGSFVLVSTIFVTGQLSRIAGGFQSTSEHETVAALNISRAASRLYAMRAALADLQISTTPDGNQRAEAEYKTSYTIFTERLDTAINAMPQTASTLLAIKEQVATLVSVTCMTAIKAGAAATSTEEAMASQALYLKD